MQLTVYNNFHGTSATLRVTNHGDEINKRTMKRLRRKLCGRPKCACGDICGTQPSQFEQLSTERARLRD